CPSGCGSIPIETVDVDYRLPYFVGLIGINNGDGTGSMDYWHSNFFEGGLNGLDIEEYFMRLAITTLNSQFGDGDVD
ncbi:MAG: hypothetical protein GTO02_03920, partial [Candidatus Dadabacteria bacterium]|nr:hypothetical protein [Candidatus Dadabacteria bacterium]NIQ13573.1 hypothetical protein [Candidatus Dadabacteria bacterium]